MWTSLVEFWMTNIFWVGEIGINWKQDRFWQHISTFLLILNAIILKIITWVHNLKCQNEYHPHSHLFLPSYFGKIDLDQHWIRSRTNYMLKENELKTLFYAGHPKEDIFLTTFYGLNFSHHHTYYKLQSFTCWTSVGIFHVLHTSASSALHVSFFCRTPLLSNPGFQVHLCVNFFAI